MKKRRKGQISVFGISERIQQFWLPGQAGRKFLLAYGSKKKIGRMWRYLEVYIVGRPLLMEL